VDEEEEVGVAEIEELEVLVAVADAVAESEKVMHPGTFQDIQGQYPAV